MQNLHALRQKLYFRSFLFVVIGFVTPGVAMYMDGSTSSAFRIAGPVVILWLIIAFGSAIWTFSSLRKYVNSLKNRTVER